MGKSSSIGTRLPTVRTAIGSVTACFLGIALSSALQAAPYPPAGDEIKLSGCLIRGEGDGGYLLTNAPSDPAWLKGEDRQVAPSAVGTTGTFTTIFYWLDGHGDLNEHVGHRVEIEGDLKGQLKEGEIKTDRKDQWTEVTVSFDGRTMKARVPHTSIVPAADRDRDRKSDILVRRVNVEHVHMLTPTCQP
jgi:hypothetical protein